MSDIYRPILTGSILTSFQQALLDAKDYGMCVHSQLGLKRERLATVKKDRIEHTLKT